MEISNNNFIPKKNDKVKKVEDLPPKSRDNQTVPATQSEAYINETSLQYNEVTSRVQRSITRDQVILAGLESIRSFAQSGMTKEESISFLQEIVAKTQFDNEKVLGTYEQDLMGALEQGDTEKIDKIISATHQNIESLTEELEMNELKKQNLRSLKNLSKENNPEELMHKVINSLQENGLPEMNIPRERITDLLGD